MEKITKKKKKKKVRETQETQETQVNEKRKVKSPKTKNVKKSESQEMKETTKTENALIPVAIKGESGDFIYDKDQVLTILGAIKPGLASKDIVESMKNFYFSGETVVTYNDRISVLYPFLTDFKGFVRADTLYSLIDKLPESKFKLKQKEGGSGVILTSKGVSVDLPSIMDEEVVTRIGVVNKEITEANWQDLPTNFSDSISVCSFAAAKSEVASTISCVYINGDKVVATDSKRIAFAKIDKEMPALFIKAEEVKNLVAIKPTHYSVSNGWILFKSSSGSIFSIRKIDGSFPEWEPLFEFEGNVVELPKTILHGIDLASVFTKIDLSAVLSITIGENLCKIVITTEGGNLKYQVPLDYEGEAISFVVNPDFLKEMIKHSTVITFAESKAKLETETYSILTALYGKDDE